MRLRAFVLGLVLFPGPLAALELSLPSSARLLAERNTGPDRYAAPVGVYDGASLPTVIIEGDIARAAWRLDSPGLTPLQVMRPLRAQLEKAGFRIALDCVSEICGGFDFRFGIEVLPGPNMYVNIGAFQFLTALRGPEGAPTEVVTVLTSTTAGSAFVQVIRSGSENATVAATADVPVTTRPVVSGDLVGSLLSQGHAALAGLEFETGSSDLGVGPFASLASLADLLKSRPSLRIALVGHTDSIGGLDANIALSRRRAQSVRRRMINAYGIAGDRMEAEGMGYLSPVASNLSAAGRDANRRVEAILLSE